MGDMGDMSLVFFVVLCWTQMFDKPTSDLTKFMAVKLLFFRIVNANIFAEFTVANKP